ncbi:small ribosomal subunit protein mS39-like isoform X2 [Cydia pomonella]|uniref:small ribosomal subunit protein mS39-like isoform X2 n=1 Tax=Cydia pomonella TaxID=82600 RepID=UPI002ADD56F2|nr:small ribosomal subunit protein mS39-like isoform X2 [Cydia pomonella]
MYSNIILQRQWSKFASLCRYSSVVEGQRVPQTTSGDGISPPPRIPRGPTDILQALAATVGPDPTAAHYKYHDDPYLIPLSNYRKRAYALSAEAGRKAAAWIRDQHSDLFATRQWDPPGKMTTPYFNADPRIEAFSPKPIYTDESKVTEEDLRYTIRNALLEDSVKVFQLLGGSEAVSELKLDFLQLLCFCNEKELDSTEWLEERWFSANARERQAATWRLGGLADKIFTSMEPKSPEAYCAIIQGMAKYYQAERAHMLYQEALEKGIPLSTDVFNSLLSCIGFLKEGAALRMDALKDLLRQMAEQGISPNQQTLSSCLRSISAWGAGKALQHLALQVIAEFHKLDIQPGLSAYYYLLCLFCKERGPRTDILSLILNDLEKRESLDAKEATDTNFFITAMGVCNDHLQDINMAERVHALLMKGDNYKLVGDAYKESIYYRHFVTVACRHAPFERTTALLDTLVPNVYVPEPSVMEEIIKTLEVGGAGGRLAGVWSQLVVFGLAKRAKLVERLLDAMANCYHYQEDEVKAQMRAAAADVVKFGKLAEEQREGKEMRSPVQKLSATALSNIIEMCSDVPDKSDPMWDVVLDTLDGLRREEAAGVPARPEIFTETAKKAAAVGKPAVSAMAVTYLAECGFEEAASASVEALAVMLNRPQEDVLQLLQNSEGLAALHPSAAIAAEAYHLAKTGTPMRERDAATSSSSSSSSSDSSDSSSDDE